MVRRVGGKLGSVEFWKESVRRKERVFKISTIERLGR